MSIELPDPISRYFETDKTQAADAVAQCFTGSAVVRDERKTYAGRDAIRAWKEQSSRTYSYVVEPLSFTQADGRLIVTARLTGDFPGSPTTLRYAFVLEDDQIADLEITP